MRPQVRHPGVQGEEETTLVVTLIVVLIVLHCAALSRPLLGIVLLACFDSSPFPGNSTGGQMFLSGSKHVVSSNHAHPSVLTLDLSCDYAG